MDQAADGDRGSHRRCAKGHDAGPDDQICPVCHLPVAEDLAVAPAARWSPRGRLLLGLGVLLVLLIVGVAAYALGRSTGSGRKVSAVPPTSQAVTIAPETTTVPPTTSLPATTSAPVTTGTTAPAGITATNSAALAYRELQGSWHTTGLDVTFVPLAGHPGQLTTSEFGGTGTPSATAADFTGVQAGSGELAVTYDFSRTPNTITVNDGSATYQAQRTA